jgi:hypothetical protein
LRQVLRYLVDLREKNIAANGLALPPG